MAAVLAHRLSLLLLRAPLVAHLTPTRSAVAVLLAIQRQRLPVLRAHLDHPPLVAQEGVAVDRRSRQMIREALEALEDVTAAVVEVVALVMVLAWVALVVWAVLAIS